MHYSTISFSIDDMSPTLGVDDPWLIQHIGRRHSNILSFGDVRTLNKLYKCPEMNKCTAQKMLSCPEPGFVNHKCECTTHASYMAKNCKDREGFQQYCFSLAPTGNCDIENIDHHQICSKTCGFCPRFKPGETAIGTARLAQGKMCADRYHNPLMCPRWKQYCANPWMHRNCRKTCGYCARGSKIGDCPNFDPDSICDNYAKKRLCTLGTPSTIEFLRARCADSCGMCEARNVDTSCRDTLPGNTCKVQAMMDMCERNPLEMFVKCPSTCNRCYWKRGTCKNNRPEPECMKMALSNLCTHGRMKDNMRRQCPSTCDSC